MDDSWSPINIGDDAQRVLDADEEVNMFIFAFIFKMLK